MATIMSSRAKHNESLNDFKPVQISNKSKNKNNNQIERAYKETQMDYNQSEFYNQPIQYNQTQLNNHVQENSSNSELLRKLNNILYILEEQQEEKSNFITEELILYVFLGVFIIYILDSFVKIGKYSRKN